MQTYEMIIQRRTIRKFSQKPIDKSDLLDCINAARLAPSAANLQPLEFIMITDKLNEVFKCTKWAAYLKNGTPQKDEVPAAYIVIISNTSINSDAKYDVGLAAGNILLTAFERGIASCIIGSINRKQLSEHLLIPGDYKIDLIIALGYPKQISTDDELKSSVKYWLDDKDILHVPKRAIKDVLHEDYFKK